MAATMGAFVGANYDSVSRLNKYLLDKEQELQKDKKDLEAVEAHHQKEIQFLKQENEDKQKQLQKKIDHVKHQLEKSHLLNQQQDNQNATLEQQLKESQLSLVASSFSILTAEEFKQLGFARFLGAAFARPNQPGSFPQIKIIRS